MQNFSCWQLVYWSGGARTRDTSCTSSSRVRFAGYAAQEAPHLDPVPTKTRSFSRSRSAFTSSGSQHLSRPDWLRLVGNPASFPAGPDFGKTAESNQSDRGHDCFVSTTVDCIPLVDSSHHQQTCSHSNHIVIVVIVVELLPDAALAPCLRSQ